MNPTISVVVVSYNTRDLLRECLACLSKECNGITHEIFVVDNHSRDGSADMVENEFPRIHLIRSDQNLGFAAANNRAFSLAKSEFLVLLNSDAFLRPGALAKAIEHMSQDRGIGLGGGRLVGRDGSWQPSARLFPSMVNDFLSLSGLAAKYSKSRLFGRCDRTWADQDVEAEVDWVPGAFSIVRRALLETIGFFDENFFLYYEEVDLCRRIKSSGSSIRYWPDVEVVHLGGESSKTVPDHLMSKTGAQLALWRMRSAFLYYRKHHGSRALFAKLMEEFWHRARALKNGYGRDAKSREKALESRGIVSLLQGAWADTDGGRVSPPRPW